MDTDSSSEIFSFSTFKKYETNISYFYLSSLIRHQAIAIKQEKSFEQLKNPKSPEYAWGKVGDLDSQNLF